MDNIRCNRWSLISPFANQDQEETETEASEENVADDLFYIEMPYGETKPRMVCNKEDPYLYSRLISTTKDRDGHKNSTKAAWKIKRVVTDKA